jgi:hypothetical protein
MRTSGLFLDSIQPACRLERDLLLALAKKCQNPIFVVTPHDVSVTTKMFVNCWVSRNTAVVELDQQKVTAVLDASTAPVGLEATVNKGRRFYFTGCTRWSNESWSSCTSCHPDGLSDNITWRFLSRQDNCPLSFP